MIELLDLVTLHPSDALLRRPLGQQVVTDVVTQLAALNIRHMQATEGAMRHGCQHELRRDIASAVNR